MERILAQHPAPWRFDGHGINDANGNRICKVQSCEPYTHPKGRPERNRTFDEISNLIKVAPTLVSVIGCLMESAKHGHAPGECERGTCQLCLDLASAKLAIDSITWDKI